MARELPIHNGRMTTDLDANGFRIKNLHPGSGFTQAQADWSQTDATAPDFIKNKPTIPAAVTVDATLTQQGAAADAKAVGDALRGGFTEWVCDSITDGYEYVKCEWFDNLINKGWRVHVRDISSSAISYVLFAGSLAASEYSRYDTELTGGTSELGVSVSLSRHLITPTKTSQLQNDGDGTHAFVTTNDSRLTNARTPTGHHATHSTGGTDAIAPADIGAAAATDLPYRLVEPGNWEFSGVPSGVVPTMEWDSYWILKFDGWQVGGESGSETDTEVEFSVEYGGQEYSVTATRNVLHDRAGNRVVVTGDTTLTLPAVVPGYLRDFLVRLEISGSTVPTITFAAPTGETLTYETDGDEFPVPDEAGNWVYSFTENCVAHKFAVSLKKVNEVLQGGS
jgi:hypothetical protein